MRPRLVLLSIAAAIAALGAACASSNYVPPDASTDAPTDVAIDAETDAMLLDACVPASEQCNGRDDDCDREIDEDFDTLGDACTAGTGACVRTGHLVCKPDGTGVTCDAQPGLAVDESCNGADDDCDGMTIARHHFTFTQGLFHILGNLVFGRCICFQFFLHFKNPLDHFLVGQSV